MAVHNVTASRERFAPRGNQHDYDDYDDYDAAQAGFENMKIMYKCHNCSYNN